MISSSAGLRFAAAAIRSSRIVGVESILRTEQPTKIRQKLHINNQAAMLVSRDVEFDSILKSLMEGGLFNVPLCMIDSRSRAWQWSESCCDISPTGCYNTDIGTRVGPEIFPSAGLACMA